MANALFNNARKSFMEAGINMATATIKAVPIKNTATVNVATQSWLSDLNAHAVGTAVTLAGKTTTAGVFDANDVTFTAVPQGSTVSGVLIYQDTGTDATSPLIAWIDTATGLPVLTNNGDLLFTWDNGANKIFRL